MRQFINIHTGEIVTPAYVDDKQKRFWFASQLTKAKVPDKRHHGIRFGISEFNVTARKNRGEAPSLNDYGGTYIELTDSVKELEHKTSELRRRITSASVALNALKLELVEAYFKAQPSDQPQ